MQWALSVKGQTKAFENFTLGYDITNGSENGSAVSGKTRRGRPPRFIDVVREDLQRVGVSAEDAEDGVKEDQEQSSISAGFYIISYLSCCGSHVG